MTPGSIKAFSVGLLLTAGIQCMAQVSVSYDPDRKFTSAELQQDLEVLKTTLKEINPSLHRFRSAKQVDSLFNALPGNIERALTAAEARKLLIVPAVVYLQDLHYVVYPSTAEEKWLRQNGLYFPFDIKLSGDKLYIWKNLSADTSIKDNGGMEIKQVNGVDAATIIKTLLQYIVTDGNSTQSKRKQDLEESFRTYYALAFGKEERFRMAVTTRGDNKIKTVTVPAASWDTINKTNAERYPKNNKLPGLEIIEDQNAAILTLNTFTPELIAFTDRELEKFIDSAFAIIRNKGVDKLVLDLRGNIGGRVNYGGKLYSYLTDKPFKYIDHIEVKYPHTFPYINNTALGRSYLTNTYGIRLAKDSVYHLENFQWLNEQKPAANNFTGKLFVLTDGYTLSTTGLFCSMLRAYRSNTTFIGEETGGAYGSTSGQLTLLTLPATGIRVYMPIRKYVSPAMSLPAKNKGFTNRGVLPDVPVSNSIDDILQGNDIVLRKALETAYKN
jgi:C-terminal processing protease CtpA/Prc